MLRVRPRRASPSYGHTDNSAVVARTPRSLPPIPSPSLPLPGWSVCLRCRVRRACIINEKTGVPRPQRSGAGSHSSSLPPPLSLFLPWSSLLFLSFIYRTFRPRCTGFSGQNQSSVSLSLFTSFISQHSWPHVRTSRVKTSRLYCVLMIILLSICSTTLLLFGLTLKRRIHSRIYGSFYPWFFAGYNLHQSPLDGNGSIMNWL